MGLVMCDLINEKQKLVDLCFELVLAATSDSRFCGESNEIKVKWIRKQLDEMGYHTIACGQLWGVLKKDTEIGNGVEIKDLNERVKFLEEALEALQKSVKNFQSFT